MNGTEWWQSSNERGSGLIARGSLAIVSVLLCASGLAHAHDPSKHRAAADHGSVLAASPGTLTIEEDGKQKTFAVMPETKVMRGEASVPVGDVKPGAHVAIFSTKLADGTAAASEINIVDEGFDAAPRAHGHPHGEADEPSK